MYIADTANSRVRTVIASGVIRTVAGTSTAGFNGDGISATAAQLNMPAACAVSATGVLLISDTANNRIRAVSVGGIITTFAGNGYPGFAGDGASATYAEIRAPAGIVLDAAGALYIADAGNNRVRRVAGANNIISTFAGSATAGFSGDGGPATAAELNGPTAVAFDASNATILIADNGNQRIRAVFPSGIIGTIAGTGAAGFGGDGGPARLGLLNDPIGVAVDAGGTVFVADTDNERVRVLLAAAAPSPSSTPSPSHTGTPSSSKTHTPSSSRTGTPSPSHTPTPSPSGIPANDVINTFAGNGNQGAGGNGGPATSASFHYPYVPAPVLYAGGPQPVGAVLIVDTANNQFRVVSPTGASALGVRLWM